MSFNKESLSSWQTELNKVSAVNGETIAQRLVSNSPFLSWLMGDSFEKVTVKNPWIQEPLKVYKFKNTYSKGREKRWALKDMGVFSDVDETKDYYIQYGDQKVAAAQNRSTKTAVMKPFEFGFTMQFTQEDKDNIEDYNQAISDWVEDSWETHLTMLCTRLLKDLENGTANSDATEGTVTTYTDGLTRRCPVGLRTAISTDQYAGVTTSDMSQWKGHEFDCDSKMFGVTAANMDSISDLLTVKSNSKTMRFAYLLQSIVESLEPKNPADISIWMHPYTYKYLFLPTVEDVKVQGLSMSFSGTDTVSATGKWGNKQSSSITPYDRWSEYDVSGAKVYSEWAKYNQAYVFPVDRIYFINKKNITFEAKAERNFRVSDWEEVPTHYSLFQKSVETTARFYVKDRFAHGVLKLDSLVKAELEAITGDIISV